MAHLHGVRTAGLVSLQAQRKVPKSVKRWRIERGKWKVKAIKALRGENRQPPSRGSVDIVRNASQGNFKTYFAFINKHFALFYHCSCCFIHVCVCVCVLVAASRVGAAS